MLGLLRQVRVRKGAARKHPSATVLSTGALNTLGVSNSSRKLWRVSQRSRFGGGENKDCGVRMAGVEDAKWRGKIDAKSRRRRLRKRVLTSSRIPSKSSPPASPSKNAFRTTPPSLALHTQDYLTGSPFQRRVQPTKDHFTTSSGANFEFPVSSRASSLASLATALSPSG